MYNIGRVGFGFTRQADLENSKNPLLEVVTSRHENWLLEEDVKRMLSHAIKFTYTAATYMWLL
jgi:hypothetical protein